MDLGDKRFAVLVDDLYNDIEVWYCIYRLREAGAVVDVLGTGQKHVCRSKYGGQIAIGGSTHAVTAGDFAGVVIPGGFAPDALRQDASVLAFVRDLFRQGKVVAAICHGPWVLCSAGVLAGRRCTSFVSLKDDVTNAGGTWVDEPVCVDGTVITARRPDDLPLFLPAIIEALSAPKRQAGVA